MSGVDDLYHLAKRNGLVPTVLSALCQEIGTEIEKQAFDRGFQAGLREAAT